MTKLTKDFKKWYEAYYSKVLKSDQGDDNLIVALVKNKNSYSVVVAKKIKMKFKLVTDESCKLLKDARTNYKKTLATF